RGKRVGLLDTQHCDTVPLGKGVKSVGAVAGRVGRLFFHTPGLGVVQDIRRAIALEQGIGGYNRRRGARGIGYKRRVCTWSACSIKQSGSNQRPCNSQHHKKREYGDDKPDLSPLAHAWASATERPPASTRPRGGVLLTWCHPPGS